MAATMSSPILQLIRRLVEDKQMRELSDQDLLRRFSAQRDETAFHALLRRHGAMVLDVSRGVLGDGPDAEDAFQATFLVLAQKAGSIRKMASLGSWLHGVAYRTALKSRAQAAARRKHEASVPERQSSEGDELCWGEVRGMLHEELNGLPQRYREPLVLCYLEGATQKCAAAQMGLAERTLRARLERGRELLRAKLVGRGLGPATVLVASAWPDAAASACLPRALVSSTVKVAGLFAAGQAGLVSPQAAALAEGVMKAMLLTRIKVATAVLFMVGVLGAVISVSILCHRTQASEPVPLDQPTVRSAELGGRIWLLENRSEITTLKPDGTDHRALLKGQKMLRWVSPAEKLVWFDGKDGTLPDPMPKVQPDGNPDRGGLTLHITPLNDNAADARQRKQMRHLIADLDSDTFTVREKADRDLASFGELAEPEMREALAEKPSAEVRQRLHKLLGMLATKATDLGIPSDNLTFTYFAQDGRTVLTRDKFTCAWALVDAVTKKRTPFKLPSGCDLAVDLAPDGSWVLAFENTDSRAAREREKEGMPQFRLHKVPLLYGHKLPLRGDNPVLLTGRLNASLGRISPDGKRVLATVYGKQASLHVIDVATQKATKISGPGKGYQAWSWAEWSPDGRHVVCAWGERFDGGKTRVAVCDADGKQAKFILTTEKRVLPIAWR